MMPNTPNEIQIMNNVSYSSAIGSLQYLVISMSPNLVYCVNNLAQFIGNPGLHHWSCVKRIMRYLKGSIHFCLTFRALDLQSHSLQVWIDLDWAGDYNTCHSTFVFNVQLAQCPISWNSKKQKTIALSSTKVEYIASTHVTKEVLWIQHLLSEIGFPQLHPTLIYCDNQSCLALTKNPCFQYCLKYIEFR